MIEEIGIGWFRGASDRIALKTDGKSVVVYGPNGSGKSSFVDAFEYLLTGGKVAHLALREAGARQQHAIINTHIGTNSSTVDAKVSGCGEISVAISHDGTPRWKGIDQLSEWECRRVILRQDEVARFVTATPADKYSAVLPLIGLGPLENVAGNFRALARKVGEQGQLERRKGAAEEMRRKWALAFGDKNLAAVGQAMRDLVATYAADVDPPPKSIEEAVAVLKPILDARISSLTAENARLERVKDAHLAGLEDAFTKYLQATEAAVRAAEPDLQSRLEILAGARGFAARLEPDRHVDCPACGTNIPGRQFQAHVDAETRRLKDAEALHQTRRDALNALADALTTVNHNLGDVSMEVWRAAPEQKNVREFIDRLATIDAAQLRQVPSDAAIATLADCVQAVCAHLRECTAKVPDDVNDLLAAKDMVVAAEEHPKRRALEAEIKRIESLVQYLNVMEAQVRDEIRERTQGIIDEISGDMQRMWAILHPDEPIEGVKLFQDPEAPRSMDIGLTFFGKQQLSPRLTLSEGHRNSLGLCVFLAIAKRPGMNKPVFLDDVVTSFDREHRSMIVKLLDQEFSDRQVFILTHDYDWYVELQRRLQGWKKLTLLPWRDPTVGIRWGDSPQGLDKARDKLDDDPADAARLARGVMDAQMAVIAEMLEIPVPFIRGVKNDLRYGVDLVQRAAGRNALARRNAAGTYDKFPELVAAARDYGQFAPLWGNPAIHGRTVTRGEAKQLIDASEVILGMFTCGTCTTDVWATDVTEGSARHLWCKCAALRWTP